MDTAAIVNSLFKSDTCSSFHDVVHEALGKSYSDEKLKEIFYMLPINIQQIAFNLGLSDTVFRNEVYVYITEQIKANKRK